MLVVRRLCVGFAYGVGLSMCGAALAADAATAGMRLAATCANCHDSDGAAVGAAVGGEFPSLSGRPKAEMLARLRALRSGREPATIMQQLLKGYSEEELERIAAHFANAPRPEGKGRGDD